MVMRMTTQTLGDWILEETRRRHMSLREFGRLVDVNHATLLRIMSPKREDDYPQVQTLMKLARGTGTDVCLLLRMLTGDDLNADGRALLLAQRIAQLPPDQQAIVDSFIMGTLLKRKDEGA